MKKYLIIGLFALFHLSHKLHAQVLIKDEINSKSLQAFQKDPQKFLVNWEQGNLIGYRLEFEEKELAKKYREGIPVVLQCKILRDGEEIFVSKPLKDRLFPGTILFPGNIFFPGNILDGLSPGNYELQIKMRIKDESLSESLSKYPRVIPFKFQIHKA